MKLLVTFFLILISFAAVSADFESEATWRHGVGCENVCTYTLYEINTGDVNTFTEASVVGNELTGTSYKFLANGNVGDVKHYVLYAVLAGQVSQPSNVAEKVLPVPAPTNFEVRIVQQFTVTVTSPVTTQQTVP